MKFTQIVLVASIFQAGSAIKISETAAVTESTTESAKVELTLDQQAQLKEFEQQLSKMQQRMSENQQSMAEMGNWWNTVKSWNWKSLF